MRDKADSAEPDEESYYNQETQQQELFPSTFSRLGIYGSQEIALKSAKEKIHLMTRATSKQTSVRPHAFDWLKHESNAS